MLRYRNVVSRVKDLTGKKFGRLTVIELAGRSRSNKLLWRCACECGKDMATSGNQLVRGTTRSCGCLQRELASKRLLNNLTGKTFGRLTVTGRAPNRGETTMWHCQCECGSTTIVTGNDLVRGTSMSCGCYSRELASERCLIDLAGRKFYRLTVIERAPNRGRRTMWHCQCDCGESTIVAGVHLSRGHTRSCGCYQRERSAESTGLFNKTRLDRGDFLDSDTRSYLYVMRAGDLVKIGVSNNPKKRAATIHNQSGVQTELAATFKGSLHDVVSWEIATHTELDKHRSEAATRFGGHTELFDVDIDHAVKVASSVVASLATS